MKIRKTTEFDRNDILCVVKKSFGNKKGLEVAERIDELVSQSEY